jgi:hypothetical protein
MTDDPIGEAVRRTVESMQRRMDDELLKVMMTENVISETAEPLTLKKMALDMARAVFNAKVFITEFEPKPGKDGKVPDAFVIDNTQMPGWGDAQRIRAMRGEPREPDKTIV